MVLCILPSYSRGEKTLFMLKLNQPLPQGKGRRRRNSFSLVTDRGHHHIEFVVPSGSAFLGSFFFSMGMAT